MTTKDEYDQAQRYARLACAVVEMLHNLRIAGIRTEPSKRIQAELMARQTCIVLGIDPALPHDEAILALLGCIKEYCEMPVP